MKTGKKIKYNITSHKSSLFQPVIFILTLIVKFVGGRLILFPETSLTLDFCFIKIKKFHQHLYNLRHLVSFC